MNITPLMTRKQVAEHLGVSPRTLEKFAVIGGGPVYIKIGKKVMYHQDDILNWIGGHKYAHINCNINTIKAS